MLDFKNLFSDAKRTVGLDIGSSSIKLVEVVDTAKGGYLLSTFAQVPLEKGVIEEGGIVDAHVLQDKIRHLVKTSRCKARKVIASLSGHKVIARRASFQTMEEEDLRQLINDEGANYLPFDDIKTINFDFQILGEGESGSGQMEVVLVAARKEVVQSFVDVIEKAGLKPVIMDVDSFALETMYEANYDFEDNDVVVLIHAGASMTNINVVKGGKSIFTRDIPTGGQFITESIQEKLGVTFEEAEQIKIGAAATDAGDPSGMRVDPLDFAETLFMEIERSIDYFRSTHGGEDIKEVILSGGSAKIAGMSDALTQRLGIETRKANPFQNIAYNTKVFNPAIIEDIGPEAALGIGLALRRVDDR